MSNPNRHCNRRFAEIEDILLELEERNRRLIVLSCCLRTRQEWAEEYSEDLKQWRIQLTKGNLVVLTRVDTLRERIQRFKIDVQGLVEKFNQLSLK